MIERERADQWIERFVEMEPTSGCWIWVGCRLPQGYGRVTIRGFKTPAHRAFREYFVGPITSGLQIDHKCRNRACVNPSHLDVVTSAENTRRSPITQARVNETKTHCPRGHRYDEANTRLHNNMRHCRTCEHRSFRRALKLMRPRDGHCQIVEIESRA